MDRSDFKVKVMVLLVCFLLLPNLTTHNSQVRNVQLANSQLANSQLAHYFVSKPVVIGTATRILLSVSQAEYRTESLAGIIIYNMQGFLI